MFRANVCPKHAELILEINKTVIFYLVYVICSQGSVKMHGEYLNVYNTFRVNNYLWKTDKMIRTSIKSNRCYEMLCCHSFCTVQIGLTSRIYYEILYTDGTEQRSTRRLTKLKDSRTGTFYFTRVC